MFIDAVPFINVPCGLNYLMHVNIAYEKLITWIICNCSLPIIPRLLQVYNKELPAKCWQTQFHAVAEIPNICAEWIVKIFVISTANILTGLNLFATSSRQIMTFNPSDVQIKHKATVEIQSATIRLLRISF